MQKSIFAGLLIMQKIITYIWRVWFYVAIFIAIVLLAPFILITSQKQRWYPLFFKFARLWAWIVLLLSGFWPKVNWLQKPDKDEVYIICPNHTSMIDIMMTLALFPNCFVFIGKKELAKLPLFGYFYKRTNILVDRGSIRSRQMVFEKGGEKLDEGIGLCVFPEGGVPEEEVFLANFKVGAFRLSVEKEVSIIPVSYPDNKRRLPFDFSKGAPGVLRAVVHPFLHPRAKGSDEIERLKRECRGLIAAGLVEENLGFVGGEF